MLEIAVWTITNSRITSKSYRFTNADFLALYAQYIHNYQALWLRFSLRCKYAAAKLNTLYE